MLVDSHCHLDYPEFADLNAVDARAKNAGVGAMLTIGTQLSKFPGVLAVAEKKENIWCTVGTHPNNVASEPLVDVETLLEHAKHPKVVGFGETGLDYYRENSPHDIQQQSFRTHITAAREENLPVIVHTRDCDDDTISILEDEYAKGAFPGLIHCFSSSQSFAHRALDLGFYISVSGIVTFKSAGSLRDVISNVPLDRLLVETDAPYLAPEPYRGKGNEPAYTRFTAEKVAEVKGVDFETLETATTDNFFKLFSKAKLQNRDQAQ